MPSYWQFFLRKGVKGKSAVDLARDLLNEFGGLRNLLHADLKTFCKSKGLGEAKFVQLQASLEMARRYLRESMDREGPLTNPDDAKKFLFCVCEITTKKFLLVCF